jgi:hypothetical protein
MSPHFMADVQPIFDLRCATCHGSTPSGNALRLTAADGYASMVGVASSCNPTLKLVVPSDPQSSLLWRKLGGSTTICGQPMPPAGSLKDTQATEFAIIEAWIRLGAKND